MSGCAMGQAGSQFCDSCPLNDRCNYSGPYIDYDDIQTKPLSKKDKRTVNKNRRILSKASDPSISNKAFKEMLKNIKFVHSETL